MFYIPTVLAKEFLIKILSSKLNILKKFKLKQTLMTFDVT